MATTRAVLLAIAKQTDSRRCLVLLRQILETPDLAERLFEVLGAPGTEAAPGKRTKRAGRRKS